MMLMADSLTKATPLINAFFNGLNAVVQSVGNVIVNAINAIGSQITGVLDRLLAIGNLNPAKLMAIAGSITALGAALVAFGGGSGIGAIADGLGKLFGGESPMEQVMKISTKLKPDALLLTAKSIRDLADAFQYFAKSTASLANFDTDKLDVIIEKMEDVRSVESGGIKGVANAIGGFIGGLFGSPDEQKGQTITTSGGSGEKDKMDQVISLLSQIVGAANQPTVIKFGDKTVEEIKTQLNFKKAYSVGVDNTYGRSV